MPHLEYTTECWGQKWVELEGPVWTGSSFTVDLDHVSHIEILMMEECYVVHFLEMSST